MPIRTLALLGVVLLGGLLAGYALWWGFTEATVKEAVEVTQGVVTILATGFAAFLAWFGFFRKRLWYPRARVEHRVTHLPLPDGTILLWVGMAISNLGEVMLALGEADIRVEQLVPPPPDLADQAGPDRCPADPNRREFEWNVAGRCKWRLTNRIEPGESDSIVYTFLLQPGPEVVSIYSYFRNETASRKKEIGWRTSSVYDLRQPSPPSASTVEVTPSIELEGG